MKKVSLFLLLFFVVGFIVLANSTPTQARSYRTSLSDTHVRGYYKKNGTYVRPYYRTQSDYTKRNNYSCIDYGRCR